MSAEVLCLHTPKRAEERKLNYETLRARGDPGDPEDPWRGGV